MQKFRRGLRKLEPISKENLYNLLKDDIEVWDSVLDVGCNALLTLFDFEFSRFKILHGIDKEPLPSDSIDYYDDHRRKHAQAIGEAYTLTEEEVQQAYEAKFHFCQKDITKWTPSGKTFSLIICSNVLHFFDNDEKTKLICKLYELLQPLGILYVRMNSTEHPDILNPENTTALGNHTYKPNPGRKPKDTFYLTEPELLLANLPNYKLLEKYSISNKKSFTRVFIKE